MYLKKQNKKNDKKIEEKVNVGPFGKRLDNSFRISARKQPQPPPTQTVRTSLTVRASILNKVKNRESKWNIPRKSMRVRKTFFLVNSTIFFCPFSQFFQRFK